MREWEIGAVENIHGALPYIQFAPILALVGVGVNRIGKVRSWDGAGGLVDRTEPGFTIPLELMAFDVTTYVDFVPLEAAAVFADLGEGEAILGATSAQLRGFGPGGRLELSDGTQLRVRAVVADALIGGGEVAVAAAWAPALLLPARYALLRFQGDRDALDAALAAAVPGGAPVRIRGRTETPILRHADAVLPLARIKQRFGEFAYRALPGGAIDRDPAWIQRNIVLTEVPLLGIVQCHRNLIPALAGAMTDLIALGHEFLIDRAAFRGCDNPREIGGNHGLSRHSWGVAVDLNYGLEIASDPRLVAVMERWGFTSGHSWLIPDPGHFEYRRPATP